jgi:hypothetical protein
MHYLQSSDEEYEFFAQSFTRDSLKAFADFPLVLHRV